MNQAEALKHIRTLIDIATQSDDIDFVHKHLREMRGLVNNALPIPYRTKKQPAKKTTKSLRLIK